MGNDDDEAVELIFWAYFGVLLGAGTLVAILAVCCG